MFRYRARNWPHTLDFDEQARWQDYRRERLLGDSGLGELSLPQYRQQIAILRSERAEEPEAQRLLDHLDVWGDDLEADVA